MSIRKQGDKYCYSGPQKESFGYISEKLPGVMCGTTRGRVNIQASARCVAGPNIPSTLGEIKLPGVLCGTALGRGLTTKSFEPITTPCDSQVVYGETDTALSDFGGGNYEDIIIKVPREFFEEDDMPGLIILESLPTRMASVTVEDPI
jgi:hypothetical protein